MANDIPLPPVRPKDKAKKKPSYIPNSNIPVEEIWSPEQLKTLERGYDEKDVPKAPKVTGTETQSFSKGGSVRGAGCAARGKGKGTMY